MQAAIFSAPPPSAGLHHHFQPDPGENNGHGWSPSSAGNRGPRTESCKQKAFQFNLGEKTVKTARGKFCRVIYATLVSPACRWLSPAHPGSKNALYFQELTADGAKPGGCSPNPAPDNKPGLNSKRAPSTIACFMAISPLRCWGEAQRGACGLGPALHFLGQA